MLNNRLRWTTSALFAALFASPACVKEDPIVTGNRPPAGDAGATPTTVVPLPDESDDDAPDCRRCSETLSTDTARGTLCRKNNPASVRLLNALVDCVCYDKCVAACPSYCSGSRIEPGCQACIIGNCQEGLQACDNDKRPQ